MTHLQTRNWLPAHSDRLTQRIAAATAAQDADAIDATLHTLVQDSRELHERSCFNLNPASNVMNPRAERLLACGLGPRASLGYPGDKYETGLEAIERIEIIAAELAAEIFGAPYVELRVGSGALANLSVAMATCRPGDAVIAPPPEIGGHVTHHRDGAAGLYGVVTHPAPVDAAGYTVDPERLRRQAQAIRPKLIVIGGSLNLLPHPVRALRAIADEVGATLLFDAAHLSGPIAGGAWPNPLAEGAHVMTMSTYKSLGGPPGGLIVTSDPGLAARLEAIAYPGLTANFDVARTAALAITLLDWKVHGPAYAAGMIATARALHDALAGLGLPVHGATRSHQLAVQAARWGGGQAAARLLRRGNLLACGIGLPIAPVPNDSNGLRLGTPEIVRWGMTPADMPMLAGFIARALDGADVAAEVAHYRRRFDHLHFVRA